MTSPGRDRPHPGGPARWDGSGRGNGPARWGGRQDWFAAAWMDQLQAPNPDRKPVRIGDAERDQAVSSLSDHFVAGRLTQLEFEERSEQASKARYSDELTRLFDDLPESAELLPMPPYPVRSRPPRPFLVLAPLLVAGLVVSSIALGAPWLLWGLFWVFLITFVARRRAHYRHHYQHYYRH